MRAHERQIRVVRLAWPDIGNNPDAARLQRILRQFQPLILGYHRRLRGEREDRKDRSQLNVQRRSQRHDSLRHARQAKKD